MNTDHIATRRDLMKGASVTAVAAVGPLDDPQAAEGRPSMTEMIEAHRTALAYFEHAIDHQEETEKAYNAAHTSLRTPLSMVNGVVLKEAEIDTVDDVSALIGDTHRKLRATHCPEWLKDASPEAWAAFNRAITQSQTQCIQAYENALEAERQRQADFGLTAADDAHEEASRTEQELLRALLAFPPATPQEGTAKAEYLLDLHRRGHELDMAALLSSIGWEVVA